MQRTFDPALVASLLERPGAEDIAKAYAPYTWDLSKAGLCLICDEPGFKNPSQIEITPGSHKREWLCAKHIQRKLYLQVEVSEGKPLVKVVGRLRELHVKEQLESQQRASLSFSERCIEGQRKRRLREAQTKSRSRKGVVQFVCLNCQTAHDERVSCCFVCGTPHLVFARGKKSR
jgi:hypothetical protein